MKIVLLVFHITIAVILATMILLQSSKGGLGSSFGELSFYHTRRGAERAVFGATIVVAFIFLFTSLANVLLQ